MSTLQGYISKVKKVKGLRVTGNIKGLKVVKKAGQ